MEFNRRLLYRQVVCRHVSVPNRNPFLLPTPLLPSWLALFTLLSAWGQSPDSASGIEPVQPPSTEDAANVEMDGIAHDDAEVADEGADVIEKTKTKKPLIDSIHEGFAGTVDGSARWIDGFFGKRQNNIESTGAYGRIRVRTYWKEYEGLKIKTRFRAELPLTNISNRINAIVGKGDTDSVIQGTDNANYMLSEGNENDWLAGLGYTPPWSKSKRVSLSAGVKFNIPVDLYTRITYKVKHNFDEKSLIRLQQTVFWEHQDGFGTSSSIDLERRLGPDLLVRWANWGKINEVTEGASYDSRIELYQHIDDKNAFLYTLGVKGETDSIEPVREYGGYLIYRRKTSRDWLYLELILGVTQLKLDTWSHRENSLVFGFGFEMLFDQSSSSRNGSVAFR